MFVAKRKDGSLFSLLEVKESEEAEFILKRECFYCPACGSTLKVKNGLIRRMHFAHPADNRCRASTEPETMYHLEGKEMLYEKLLQYDKVQLEYYLPSTNQRADVYMKRGNKEYAFEFQCSSISPASFIHRTKLYESASITPVWIIGKDKLGGIHQNMSLTPFQWLFLLRNSRETLPHILSFCPQESSFYYLYPLFSFNSTKTCVASIKSKEWSPIAPNPAHKEVFWQSAWLNYKKKWRYEYCMYKQHLTLRNYSYSKMHIPLSFFPSEIGIPVRSYYWIHTPIIEWQAWLYFDSIYQTPASSIIHIPSVLKRFDKRIHHSHIKLRELPLIKEGKYQDAVLEYLEQLATLGVLEAKGEHIFKKVKREEPALTIEDAAKQDLAIYNALLK